MTRGGSVDLRVQRIERSGLPGVEAADVLARLGRGERPAGFPLFDPTEPPRPSGGRVDREQLAEALVASNERMGHSLSDRAVRAIRRDGSFVVAGQQPGLLLGPMYTLLKAISASAMAGRLSHRWSQDVLPAFWIASEDHALGEVNHCHLSGKALTIDHSEIGSGRPPVGDISLTDWKPTIVDFVDQALPSTPHKAWVKQLVEETDFTNYTTAFASLLPKILGDPDLVVIDPHAVRPLLAPPLAAIAERWPAVRRSFAEGSEMLRTAGVDPPLRRVNLFEFADGSRTPCEEDDDGMTIGGERVDFPEAADRIRAEPERFSPSAGLRPIVQDAALPVSATIGGPAELHYLWQVDPVYSAVGVQRSHLWPRIRATFLDERIARAAERFGLTGGGILHAQQAAEQYDPSRFGQRGEDLDEVDRLGQAVLEAIDRVETQDNQKLVSKARGSIEHQLQRIVDRVHTERMAREGLGKGDLKKVAETVRPGGRPQERVLSPVDLLARYGPEIVPAMREALDPETLDHQLVVVAYEPHQ